MKKILLYAAVPAVLLAALLIPSPSSAATFNPARIIDDSVFTNNTSMSAAQIQSFLNNKVPTCDTNGTLPAGDFGRPDLTHAQYAALRGWSAPPYTCLRNMTENGLTAAQIIYNTSQQYRINPQVFIVLLQKETGLVTDTWPLPWQYRTATGYGCPDTAACDSQYFGLTNQITWAAKLFRSVLNQSPTWYSPYVAGVDNYVRWSPRSECGGSVVRIENWSTAALYDYTPYQPNQSALNAGYGTGDSCGAYGNRNFFLYFTDWFGVTSYAGKPIRTSSPNSGVFLVENGTKRPFDSIEALYSNNYTWADVLTVSDALLAEMPTGTPIGINIPAYTGRLLRSDSPGSGIFLVENSTKRPFDSVEALYSHNYTWANVLKVSDALLAQIPTGTTLGINVPAYAGKLLKSNSPGSGIFLIENGTKRPFDSAAAFNSYGYDWNKILTVSDFVLANIPLGSPVGVR